MPRRRFDDDDEGFWTPAAGRDYNIPFTYRLGRFLQSLGGTMGGAEDRQQSYLESFVKMQRDEAEEQRRRKLAEETSRHNLAQEKLTQKRLEDVDAEREAARQERAATQQAGVLSQGLFRRQPTEVRTGVPTPEPLRAPGEGGVSVRQELRKPELDEVLEKATEQHGVTPGVIQALSRLYKERFPEAQPKAPKQHVVGGALVDELGNVIYRSPEKPEKPTAESRQYPPAYLAGVARGALKDPNLTPEAAKGMLEDLEKHAKAGAASVNVNTGVPRDAGAREKVVQGGALLDSLDRVDEAFKANPSWAGGIAGASGIKGQIQQKFNQAPPGWSDFASEVFALRAQMINALAGAAIGPAEAEYYMKSIPGIGAEGIWGGQSSQEFAANLKITRRNMAKIQERILMMAQDPDQLKAEYAKLKVGSAAELEEQLKKRFGGASSTPAATGGAPAATPAPRGKAIRSIRPLP